MFNASENNGLSRLSRQLNYVSSGHKPLNRHEWGPGVRDIYAMHYIIKGKGIYKTRSGEYELQAGQSFLIYPYTEIYYYPDPNDPWEYVCVEFTGEEVAHILDLTRLSADDLCSDDQTVMSGNYWIISFFELTYWLVNPAVVKIKGIS